MKFQWKTRSSLHTFGCDANAAADTGHKGRGPYARCQCDSAIRGLNENHIVTKIDAVHESSTPMSSLSSSGRRSLICTERRRRQPAACTATASLSRWRRPGQAKCIRSAVQPALPAPAAVGLHHCISSEVDNTVVLSRPTEAAADARRSR